VTKDVYAQANEEFQCDHTEVALRRRAIWTKGKQTYHIWKQCMRCGKGIEAVKKHPLSSVREDELEPYDEQLQAQWREKWQARVAELRAERDEQKNEDWWAEYEAYMRTPQWQEMRARVLARDGRVCQGCLGASGVPDTQVHHLTYEHLGHEFAWELVTVCRVCHERLHGRALSVPADRVPDEQTARKVEAALSGEQTVEDLDHVPF
jgi:5-methylcytosine-specific restriction endonuclease McrA